MGRILAISGGVGGAKLAMGLSQVVEPESLTIIANVADDFEHLRLPISPDIDTLVYTLSGLSNTERGWGRGDETWSALETLEQLGAESWFQLGDRDLALHIFRRYLLDQGLTLSQVTLRLARRLGIKCSIIPMSDQRVSTIVESAEGPLPFQTYFVQKRCEPEVTGFHFEGIETASLSPGFLSALEDPDLDGVIICPSNPFVSVGPVLALPGLREKLAHLNAPVIAVTPLVGGKAIKGPTAKMMAEMDIPRSVVEVARLYRDFLDGFVLDEVDADQSESVQHLGLKAGCAQTVMSDDQDKAALAQYCLGFLEQLREEQ